MSSNRTAMPPVPSFSNVSWRDRLGEGLVIPACPLALDRRRRWDEQGQAHLIEYYLRSGAGGLAVGVHTTQFQIRDRKHGLFEPLLDLASAVVRGRSPETLFIGGICGKTRQAVREASLLARFGCHAGLLSLGALRDASDTELLKHCRVVAETIPIIGFYLQPSVGGRRLSYQFWRKLAELDRLIAIKIAPFNRYQTVDVVRAVAESGRAEIALYTGNDDNIVNDLLTPFRFRQGHQDIERRIVGGLLGQWAVWTRRAVELHAICRGVALSGKPVPAELLRINAELTDANAAIFDAAHGFAGCIPGIHEVLRREGLMKGTWCLDPVEQLSRGQKEEIDRVWKAYPHLRDDGPKLDSLERS